MLYGQLDEFRQLSGCDDLIIDGEVHRYGDKKTKWYALHDMGNAFVGVFADWRGGEISKWISSKSGQTFTKSEMSVLQTKIEESRAKALEEKRRVQNKVADEAKQLWAQCKKDGFVHKYLDDKRVKAHGIGWYRADLIIPLQNHNGELRSYQKISSSGTKFFPEGGQVKGLFHKIKGSAAGLNKTFICEGYATGATIYEATGATVIVALNAGNIPAVAEYFPSAIVACDNDQFKPDVGNAGVEAGKKSGLEFVIPKFVNLTGEPTDFNDLMLHEGLYAVQRQLMTAAECGRIELISMSALLDFKIEERPIIKGLLDEKESMLIIGRSGLGKSLLTTELAIKLGMASIF